MWIAAIKNKHYASWPGPTAVNTSKYFPESEEVWKGHGRTIKTGLRSTKEAIKHREEATRDDADSKSADIVVAMVVYNFQDNLTSKMYTD